MKPINRMSKFPAFAVVVASAIVLLAMIFTLPPETGKAKQKHAEIKQTGIWQKADKESLQSRGQLAPVPNKVPVYRLNRTRLNEVLAQAPLEFTLAARQTEIILAIPTPEGGITRFRIEESPMLATHIAAQFPTWKQYSGQGIDDPTATARFDVNDLGFHGYIIGAKGTFLIDPYSLEDNANYIVYRKGDIGDSNRENFSCKWKGNKSDDSEISFANGNLEFTNGTQLRTFRLAVSAAKEYTNFFGGNVNTAFAGIQTTVNRMITVYRRELATTFTLVSGTNTVFTNANNGGFPDATAPNASNTSLDRNQVVLDAAIGTANYDIGHVVSRTPNPDGLASSPSLCDNTAKAQGFTGGPTPQGDGYDVDYVAHEIGHQFGMSHTFNDDNDGSCGGNSRSATSAYEPASGITIMGYGGICAPRNMAANSIEYFNLRSFDQSLAYLQTTIPAQYPTCGSSAATGNTAPTVTTSGNFNIPKQTPFTLTASATDPNGDTLTYLWEEFDLGGATRNGGAVDTDEDGTARPIFRAYNPTTSGSRTFPSLYYILNNANVPPLTYTGTLPFAPTSGSTFGYVCAAEETCVTGERLPSISRTMNFRVTVRDNRAGGGGVADAQSTVTVAGGAGPFNVTAPNTALSWAGNSSQTVTWNVAGTNAAPINAANVRISLSTDGGQTFPTVLSASTANDGSEAVTIPNTASTTARIKIEAVGNIFFDISNTNFTITGGTARAKFVDFDGDQKTDISIYRPSLGQWWYQRSSDNLVPAYTFGTSTDIITPADYDGDGKTDIAFFRPSTGEWFVLRSSNLTFFAAPFGANGDVPAPGDFDGDNKADFTVFRSGTWFINKTTGGVQITPFGITGDIPVVGDYDNDGKADVAIYRPNGSGGNGEWWMQRSTAGFFATPFGNSTDKPVVGDYTGDGKADCAFFRPSTGEWFVLRSDNLTYFAAPFGASGDTAVPGDYDGDGKNDLAVFRPSNSTWFVQKTTGGTLIQVFGTTGDRPVPNAFVP